MKIKHFLLLLLLWGWFDFATAEVRATWLPVWNFNSAQKIDQALADCRLYGITDIIAQVRYRGDAMYIPNKTSSKYPNPEPKAYLLETDFDPLQYLLDQAGEIKIHAWITVFVITPHDLAKIDSTHVYYTRPEWVTADFTGSEMSHDSHEGAFLDPGIAAVQQYTLNIILDIVTNYQPDGIHLDYIRYPDWYYGLNSSARQRYKKEIKYQDADSWLLWKEKQISNFVQRVYQEINVIAPQTILSAAVIAQPLKAQERFLQNWFSWLEAGFIDYVYPMAYTTSDAALLGLYEVYPTEFHAKIIPGLRAWSSQSSYSVKQINSKIALSRRYTFPGFALYSYSGIIDNNYFPKLKIRR
jgi:uncharacterized lipoprotein YddW (UPF0748 family)